MDTANNPQLERERAVYNYLDALESGDIDSIIEVLNQAIYDAPLDQMIAEAHGAFFQAEATQQTELVEMDTHEMPALEPATLRSHGSGQSRRAKVKRMSRWVQTLAAVLILGVLVGSFAAVLAVRKGLSNVVSPGKSTPVTTPIGQLPACYPLRLFDTPRHGTGINALMAVTAISANDTWAVGYSSGVTPPNTNPQERHTTLIEHWDGKSWQIVPSPNGADGNGSLNSVAAVSANDIWAVGTSLRVQNVPPSNSSLEDRTLIEHWDGKSWSVVSSPNNVKFNGLTFSNGGLNAVTVVSADNVWAAGHAISADDSPSFVTLIEHWDGKGWRVVPGVGNTLTGIFGMVVSMQAISANDIWAVGYMNQADTTYQGLLQHWDGTHWKLFPTASNSGMFTRLSVASSHDIWVTGINMGHGLLMHWDGRQWSQVPGPQILTTSQIELSGVAALTPQDVWVVGWGDTSSRASYIFVIHWDGKIWQQVKTPDLAFPGSISSGITVSADHQIWIVGWGSGQGSAALIEGQRTCP